MAILLTKTGVETRKRVALVLQPNVDFRQRRKVGDACFVIMFVLFEAIYGTIQFINTSILKAFKIRIILKFK